MEEDLQTVCNSIDEVYSKVDGSEEIGVKLKERLRKAFISPPLEDFEKLMGKKLSVEEAQHLLFNPDHYDVGLCSLALWSAATGDLKNDQGAQKTHALILALIYLHHRKNNSFVLSFIQTGGLRAIVFFVTSENLYERSQAIEIFLSAINTDMYDWFVEPLTELDRNMHQSMLQLGTEYSLVSRALDNRTKSYPGGSFRALQILAFWLSWCRVRFPDCLGGFLTGQLKAELEAWAAQTTSAEPPKPVKATPEEMDEQERQLATVLYDDFFNAKVSLPPVSDDTVKVQELPVLPPAPPSAAVLKEEGNSLFKAGMFDEAAEKYDAALQVLDGDVSLEVNLRVNLANTYWKLASSQVDKNSLLELIISHCQAALAKDPSSNKALYRLISTLLEQGKTDEAWGLLEPRLQGHVLGEKRYSKGKGFQTDEFDTSLKKLAYRCVAKEMVTKPSGAGTKNPFKSTSAKSASPMFTKVFSSLCKRNNT
eukprot:gene38785-47165_t